MKKKNRSIPREALAFIHFGWSVALLLTGSCLLGYYLDKKFQTQPALVISFSLLGILISGYLFFSTIKKLSNAED